MDWAVFNWLAFYGAVFGLTLVATFLSKILATKLAILDHSASAPGRKFQKIPVPLLGGIGLVLTSTLAMSLVWLAHKFGFLLLPNLIYPFRLIWLVIAILGLTIIGFFDDLGRISARVYISGVLLALALAVWLGGLKIEVLSYPFDGFNFGQINFFGVYLSQILAFLWLLACTASTKFVDGSDGLAATIGLITFLTIGATAGLINQPLISIFALIWAISLIGFLPWNFPEAQVYLGDGGSLIIGFMVGVLSILGGAKVATAGTVLGWFVLDIMLVMLTRLSLKQNILAGDSRLHWHHRLAALGFSKVQVLVFTTIVLLLSAHLGLFWSTSVKMWIILAQLVLLILIFTFRKK